MYDTVVFTKILFHENSFGRSIELRFLKCAIIIHHSPFVINFVIFQLLLIYIYKYARINSNVHIDIFGIHYIM